MVLPGRAGLQTWPINCKLVLGDIAISIAELARLAATSASLTSAAFQTPPCAVSRRIVAGLSYPKRLLRAHRTQTKQPQTLRTGLKRIQSQLAKGVALARSPLAMPGADIHCSPRCRAALGQFLADGHAAKSPWRRSACKKRRERIHSIAALVSMTAVAPPA